MRKLAAMMMVIMVLSVSSSVVFAADESSFGKDMKKAGEATVRYPANAVEETVNVTGYAVKGTTDTAVSPIKAFWRNLIGKGEPQEVVTDPVNTAGKTVYDATKGTVTMPVEAGKKTRDQMQN